MSKKIKAGNLLIAEPFMLDPNFKRAVVLICEHHKEGTTGFVLNKPLNMKMEELIMDFPETKAPVHIGGPVSTDTIHYLHNVGDMLDDSLEVCKGVYWGGDFTKLKFLMENGLIKDDNIKFFVGYSGWTGGQLEDELKDSSWMISDMDANYLFKTKPFVLWQTVLHNKGDAYTVIAQMPDSISLN
jgi:putative transcriptional regulator